MRVCGWVGACLCVCVCVCVCVHAFLLSNVSLILTSIPPGVVSLTHPALKYRRGPNQGPSLLRFQCCIPKAISSDHRQVRIKLYTLYLLPGIVPFSFLP